MVLLIPDAVKKIRMKERKERDQFHFSRRREAYKRFGFQVDGKLVLPDTPEVEAFLNGETEEE